MLQLPVCASALSAAATACACTTHASATEATQVLGISRTALQKHLDNPDPAKRWPFTRDDGGRYYLPLAFIQREVARRRVAAAARSGAWHALPLETQCAIAQLVEAST